MTKICGNTNLDTVKPVDMFEEHLLRYLENVPSNAFEGDASEKAAEELISRTTPLSSKDTLKQRWEVAIRAEILSLAVISSVLWQMDQPDGVVGTRTVTSKGRSRRILRTHV